MTNENEEKKSESNERIGDYVSIFKRGGRWYANYQSDGKQFRRSLKTSSKKEARSRAVRIEAGLLSGELVQRVRKVGIYQVVESYKKYLRTEERAKKTLAKIDLVCRRMLELAARTKSQSILDVDLAFVDKYRQERSLANAKPKTLQNETVIIRQLVNFAMQRRMISKDPLHGLKIKKVRPTRQPCWSRAEVDSIVASAKVPYQNLFTLLAETGMRIGEARWLTWEDVDLKGNTIAIRAKKDWKPKNGEDRLVPISQVLRNALEELQRAHCWVFTAPKSARYPKGDHQISDRRALQSLQRLLKTLDLPGHLHTFRHSFISWALASGVPLSTLQSWVGHLDPNVTRLYTHVLAGDSQAAMERLNGSRRAEPEGGKEVA